MEADAGPPQRVPRWTQYHSRNSARFARRPFHVRSAIPRPATSVAAATSASANRIVPRSGSGAAHPRADGAGIRPSNRHRSQARAKLARFSDLQLLERRPRVDDVVLELQLGLLEPGCDADELREVEDRQLEALPGRRLELRLP